MARSRTEPPPDRIAALRRGINITGWFRFPGSTDPAALRAWLGDPAIADIRAAGFTFVRLAADPAVLADPMVRETFVGQIRRLQSRGLAVIVSPHPVSWQLDSGTANQARLAGFWHDLAQALRGLPPELTFPEIVNEPVFHTDPSAWWAAQHKLLTEIRAVLPAETVVLTGHDWGSIGGLLALPPEADRDVVYSFHFSDPPELTSLAAYRPGLDRAAMGRLPFPRADLAGCESTSGASGDPSGGPSGDQTTRDLIHFYCGMNWDEPRVTGRLMEAVSWAKRHGVRLLAGEFGASIALNPRARLAWLRLVRQTCEANGIGWALWGYDDAMGLNVSRPPPARPMLDRSVLAALGLAAP